MSDHKHIWGKPYFFNRYAKCIVKNCDKIQHLKDGDIFSNNFKDAYNSGKRK